MKRLIVALVATTVTLSISSPAALADPTPAPTTSPLSSLEQYRVDRDAFMAAMKNRAQQMNLINADFKRACDKAKRDFKSAMNTARTPDQKNLAVATRDTLISAAIIARDNSINLLGDEPTPPAEPMRPQKMQSKSKAR